MNFDELQDKQVDLMMAFLDSYIYMVKTSKKASSNNADYILVAAKLWQNCGHKYMEFLDWMKKDPDA